ncbi:hypothetical protein KAR48_09780 [bacterium]|nr:hypothetical protein [bacterium]
MSTLCFEHRLNAEPAPSSRTWKAQLGGPVAAFSSRKRQTWPTPLTFGLNEKMVWTKGGMVEAKVDWELLSNWSIQGDWLILFITGLPCLYYPLSKLREQGMYKWIMQRLESVEQG